MLLGRYQYNLIEAGCDEAGRGCLAGPVFAAAVILPDDFEHHLLNDSKQLTEEIRYQLRIEIEQKAVVYAVASVDNSEIDKINILNASFLAMHRAIEKLSLVPQFLIIDGNRFNKYGNVPHQCIVEGDAKYLSIAAASILAKVSRDALMRTLDTRHPGYGFADHKGYPVRAHYDALSRLGACAAHRRSFGPVREVLGLPPLPPWPPASERGGALGRGRGRGPAGGGDLIFSDY